MEPAPVTTETPAPEPIKFRRLVVFTSLAGPLQPKTT
jgi:hypothetical protein